MKKEMLINVLQPEECRIAILEDGVLEELYVERTSHESYVGNIYKGRIVNIEPSIQAAFVDFGVGRNGFLHVSDVEPAYYRHLEQRRGERDRDRGHRNGGRRNGGRDRDRDWDRERPPARRPAPAEEEWGALPPEPGERSSFAEVTEDLLTEESRRDAPAEAIPETPVNHEGPVAEEGPRAAAAPEPAEPPEVPPLVALPETRIEEEPTKGRRRSRGSGSRRGRGKAAEKAAEEAKDPEPESPEPETPPKPRLMDSAEHRTTEKHSGPNAPHEVSSPITDDDLVFTRPEPANRIPEPEPEPELEPQRQPEPPPIWDPPPRARPKGRSRESIEDQLAADLEAAEVAEPAASSEFGFEPVPVREAEAEIETTIESEPEPAAEREFEPVVDDEEMEPGPRREAESELEVDLDRGFGDEFDEDELPPPRRRDDRRGPRDEGRGRGRDRDRGRGGRDRGRMGGRPGMGRPKPLIQDIFRRGQEVIVQVIKEGIGTKGPTLSTYISIAGRYLVLMPGLNRVGVSRKIADDEQRRRLREIFNELKPPKGLGFIIRTAGIDKNKKELQNDLAYLSRLWQVVARRIRKMKGPGEIYQESDMITRTIRDTFTSDIDVIWVDEPNAFAHAQEFLQIVMPRYASRIKLYEGKEPLFYKYGIEDEIARIQMRKVPLPHGGSIVIEQTEALVAIDVNSGNFRADNNAEETAYQMNLHAAKEIARQLRLRDLGGVIVNDFIDMRDDKHRRAVEKAVRDAVKRDRARTKILKISAFGIIEMTRQRIRPSLKRSVYQDCPYCHGMAQVKTCESMSIDVMRMLQLAAHRDHVRNVQIVVAEDVAAYLLNRKRREIAHLEEEGGIQVAITGRLGAPPESLEFTCYDNNNNEVKFLASEEPVRHRR